MSIFTLFCLAEAFSAKAHFLFAAWVAQRCWCMLFLLGSRCTTFIKDAMNTLLRSTDRSLAMVYQPELETDDCPPSHPLALIPVSVIDGAAADSGCCS